MVTSRRGLLSFIASGLAALLMLVVGPPVSPSAASQVDRATVVQQWVDARNRGDVEGVFALQTENAAWIAGPCQAQSPCVGDRIRSLLEGTAAVHTRITLSDLQVAGSIVTARYELRSDTNC